MTFPDPCFAGEASPFGRFLGQTNGARRKRAESRHLGERGAVSAGELLGCGAAAGAGSPAALASSGERRGTGLMPWVGKPS